MNGGVALWLLVSGNIILMTVKAVSGSGSGSGSGLMMDNGTETTNGTSLGENNSTSMMTVVSTVSTSILTMATSTIVSSYPTPSTSNFIVNSSITAAFTTSYSTFSVNGMTSKNIPLSVSFSILITKSSSTSTSTVQVEPSRTSTTSVLPFTTSSPPHLSPTTDPSSTPVQEDPPIENSLATALLEPSRTSTTSVLPFTTSSLSYFSPTTDPPSTSESPQDYLPINFWILIALVAVGIILALVLILLIGCCVWHRRRYVRSYDLTKERNLTYGRSYMEEPLPNLSSTDDDENDDTTSPKVDRLKQKFNNVLESFNHKVTVLNSLNSIGQAMMYGPSSVEEEEESITAKL